MATSQDNDEDRPLELPIVTSKRTRRNSKFKQDKPNHLVKQQQVDNEQHEQYSTTGPRDPRFDPKCSGSNERRHFVRNYAFLNDVKRNELNELHKALKSEQSPEKKDKIKMAIARFRNKMIASDHQDLNTKKTRGKFKKLELADKFKQLKESGKLTKYLERKRKKLLKRDSKSFA